MKKFDQKALFFVFLLNCFFLLFHCLFGQGIKIKNENGIPVVYNPKNPTPPAGTLTKLILEEDLTIGTNEKDSDYFFEVILTIRVDNDENIYVLDRKANTIRVFDKYGKHLINIGEKGQGPGEFQSPTGIHIIGSKKIMVASFGRLSFFSLQGEYLKQITALLWDPNPIPDSKGNIIAITRSPRGRRGKFVDELRKFNSNLEPIISIGKIEKNISPISRNPFSPTIFYAVMKDDGVVWGIDNRYELIVVNKKGKTIRKIRKEYDPIDITEEDKQNYLKRRKGERYKFPKYYPAYRYISTDDEGRIFVRTYESDEMNNRYYDVFDSEGRYIAKITLKNHPTFWKKKKLYCVKEDVEGFHQLKRYKVNWK